MNWKFLKLCGKFLGNSMLTLKYWGKAMKKKNLLFGLIVVAAVLMILPSSSIADTITYSGAWEPNSDDVFFIDLTPTDGSESLYMYDWGDTDKNLFLLSDGIYNNVTVYFTKELSTWYAGLDEGVETLNLGVSNWFGLYFSGSCYTSYDLTSIGKDAYRLYEPNTKMTVVVHDAAPVPIPSTVWIFGAGVIGILGIRRKIRS